MMTTTVLRCGCVNGRPVVDTDGDGVGNNADTDDDGDGYDQQIPAPTGCKVILRHLRKYE